MVSNRDINEGTIKAPHTLQRQRVQLMRTRMTPLLALVALCRRYTDKRVQWQTNEDLNQGTNQNSVHTT
jgi:hypothetical protein